MCAAPRIEENSFRKTSRIFISFQFQFRNESCDVCCLRDCECVRVIKLKFFFKKNYIIISEKQKIYRQKKLLRRRKCVAAISNQFWNVEVSWSQSIAQAAPSFGFRVYTRKAIILRSKKKRNKFRFQVQMSQKLWISLCAYHSHILLYGLLCFFVHFIHKNRHLHSHEAHSFGEVRRSELVETRRVLVLVCVLLIFSGFLEFQYRYISSWE